MKTTTSRVNAALLTGLTILSLHSTMTGQQRSFYGKQAQEICAGSSALSYSDISKVPAYIKLGDAAAIQSADALQFLTNALKIKDDEKLVLYKTETDGLGYTHKRYQQYYKNVKVD